MAHQHQSTNQALSIILDTKSFSNSHRGMPQYQNNNKPTVGVTMAMTDSIVFQKAESMHTHETNLDIAIESADKSPNSPSDEEKKESKIMSIKKRSFPYRYHQRARWARGVNSRTKRIANSVQFPNGQMAPSDVRENPGGRAPQMSPPTHGKSYPLNDTPQAGPNDQQQSGHTFMSMWVGIASMFRSKSASETQESCPEGTGNSMCARIEYNITDSSGSQNSPETDQSHTSPTRLNMHPSQISSSQISASTLSECSTVRMETVKNKTKLRGKSLYSSGSITMSKDDSSMQDQLSTDNGLGIKREKRVRERGSPVDPKRLRLVLRSIQKHMDEDKKKVNGSKRMQFSGAQKNKVATGKTLKLQGSPTRLLEPFSGTAVHSIIKPSQRNKSPELYPTVDYESRSRSFDRKLFTGNGKEEERYEPIPVYKRNRSTPALAAQPTDNLPTLAHIFRNSPNEENCRGAPSTFCWMGDEFPIPPHYSPASHKRVQFNTCYPTALEPVGTTSLYPGKRPDVKSSSALAARQPIRYKFVDSKSSRAMNTGPRVNALKDLHLAGSSPVTHLQRMDRTQKMENSSRSFPNLVKSSSDEAEKCIRKRITKHVSNPIYKRQRQSASQPDKSNIQYRSSPSSCSLLEF